MAFGIESAIPNSAPYKANVAASRVDRQVGETRPFCDVAAAAAWIDEWISVHQRDGFEIVRAEIYDSRNEALLAGTAELTAPKEGEPW